MGAMGAMGDRVRSAPVVLSRSLQIILETIPDGEERARFKTFFEAAAAAMQSLSDLNLDDHQVDVDESMHLAVWEAVAPAVKRTLNEVNNFLGLVQTHFPPPSDADRQSIDDAFEELFSAEGQFGENTSARINVSENAPAAATTAAAAATTTTASADRSEQLKRAAALLHAIWARLTKDVGNFGVGLRNPRVMGDRWKLLDYIAQFRGKFRAGIGEMVFLAAESFAAVQRDDVVPFYREDMANSVLLRRAVMRMTRRVRQLQEAWLNAADRSGACEEWLLRVLHELEEFMHEPAYALLMREADKRSVLDAQRELRGLCEAEPEVISALQIDHAVEGLVRFFDSLRVVSRREILIVHDCRAMRRARDALGALRACVRERQLVDARETFRRVVAATTELLGRDEDLDEVLLLAAHVSAGMMDLEAIDAGARLLAARLERVPAS